MRIKSFRWKVAKCKVEIDAAKVFEVANTIHQTPCVAIDEDGSEYLVTHAYFNTAHQFIRFDGGYSQPFVLAELKQ